MNDRMKDIPCEVIQDILPLYHDQVCSEKSCMLVETHLQTCEKCKQFLESLDEGGLEEELRVETQDVLWHHAKKEKTLAVKTGIFIAGILILPVIIAVILTLPGYSDWKTNAVLIASMLLVAGMTVVPLVSKKKKFSKTIICSTIALLLVIFFTEMFFDNGGLVRFGEIACSVIFGISIPFFPFLIRQAELPETLENHKGLLTMSWDTLWFYLMIFIFAVDYPEYFRELVFVSSFFVAAVWLIFVIVRYAKVNRFIKAGSIVLISSVWTAIGYSQGWVTITGYDIDRKLWIASLIVGISLIGIGILIGRRKNEH